jgi:hypothetical protein
MKKFKVTKFDLFVAYTMISLAVIAYSMFIINADLFMWAAGQWELVAIVILCLPSRWKRWLHSSI